VEVADTAPLLGTVNATLGRVVDNRAMLNLPLGGRGSLDLVTLAPGGLGGPGNTRTNFVTDGTRNSQADVLIDGVSVTAQEPNGGVSDATFRPTVEAIQEFKVQTNSFRAEYGNTGGAVINMVTRSSTNQLQGTVFEFHQRNILNYF
jgi:outer membrane cobalamin receptor